MSLNGKSNCLPFLLDSWVRLKYWCIERSRFSRYYQRSWNYMEIIVQLSLTSQAIQGQRLAKRSSMAQAIHERRLTDRRFYRQYLIAFVTEWRQLSIVFWTSQQFEWLYKLFKVYLFYPLRSPSSLPAVKTSEICCISESNYLKKSLQTQKMVIYYWNDIPISLRKKPTRNYILTFSISFVIVIIIKC